MTKPKLFIGSSTEGKPIAYAIQKNLKDDLECTVWDQNVFDLSHSYLDSLINRLNFTDFAIFVFSADDDVKIRGSTSRTVRDNVVFELGLFTGRLGKERSFFVHPEKIDIRIATDLDGISSGSYETNRSDDNLQSATAPFCDDVRIKAKQIGSKPNNTKSSEEINFDFDDLSDKEEYISIKCHLKTTKYERSNFSERPKKITEITDFDISISWQQILSSFAYNAYTGINTFEASQKIANTVSRIHHERIQQLILHGFSGYVIILDEEDFERILLQLQLLGYLDIKTHNEAGLFSNRFIKLTGKGLNWLVSNKLWTNNK